MTETAADFEIQVIAAQYEISMSPPTAIDRFVQWIPFGRRELPLKLDRLRMEIAHLQIRRGLVYGLAVSNALLRSKLFGSIEGREAPSGGVVQVKGRVSSASEIRNALAPSLSVSEALLAAVTGPGGDMDRAKRWFEASFLFSGMLDLAYVKIQDISELDRARIAATACLFREADIYLLDEISLVFDQSMIKKICGRAALLAASGKTVVLASADRDWLQSNCNAVISI